MLRGKGRGCVLAGRWSRELDGRYPGQHSRSDLSDVLFVGVSQNEFIYICPPGRSPFRLNSPDGKEFVRSMLLCSSCLPRFSATQQEIPTYIRTFSSLEYFFGFRPRSTKKPLPLYREVPKPMRRGPSVGSWKVWRVTSEIGNSDSAGSG